MPNKVSATRSGASCTSPCGSRTASRAGFPSRIEEGHADISLREVSMTHLTRGAALLCAFVLLITGAVAAQQTQPQRGGSIVIALGSQPETLNPPSMPGGGREVQPGRDPREVPRSTPARLCERLVYHDA